MKLVKFALFVLVALGLIATTGFAVEGSVEKGKAHFNNPNFAGGKKACNECHPNGRGLENAAQKTKFNIFGKSAVNLEGAVNICIVNANKGKAIAVDSQEMKDIVAYIKSLGKAAAPGYKAPGYGAPGYGAPAYK